MSGKIGGAVECYQHPNAPNHYPEIGGLAAMADAHSIDPKRFWKFADKAGESYGVSPENYSKGCVNGLG